MTDRIAKEELRLTPPPNPWMAGQPVTLTVTQRGLKRFRGVVEALRPLPKQLLYWCFVVPAYYAGFALGACVSACANLWYTTKAGVIDGYRASSIERR